MPDALERPPASLLPLPSDPKTWHADTLDVFLTGIVGSGSTRVLSLLMHCIECWPMCLDCHS